MNKTPIEWTDYSWPVVNGCRRKSAGCGTGREGGCYAERLAATRLKHTARYRGLAVMTDKGPQWTGETRLIEEELDRPLRLRKPSRIFVADMGDLFYEGVPDDVIDRVFAVMLLAPRHTFQVLTKRPKRMLAYLTAPDLYARVLRAADAIRATRRPELMSVGVSDPWRFPPRWIWWGTSVEDQATVDERIPLLLQCPAARRWVSLEPQLEDVDLGLGRWIRLPRPVSTEAPHVFPGARADAGCYRATSNPHGALAVIGGNGKPLGVKPGEFERLPSLDFVVVGGESGPRARAFDLAWARHVIKQCREAGTAVFCKQLGARPVGAWEDLTRGQQSVGTSLCDRVTGRFDLRSRFDNRKGGDPNEWPNDLRVREAWPS